MGQRSRSRAQDIIVIARGERERERSLEFSPMAPLGGGAVEMTTRHRSIEASGDALLGRWFQVRGGEVGAGVGALIAPIIGS
jgi:hypothetical protein